MDQAQMLVAHCLELGDPDLYTTVGTEWPNTHEEARPS